MVTTDQGSETKGNITKLAGYYIEGDQGTAESKSNIYFKTFLQNYKICHME